MNKIKVLLTYLVFPLAMATYFKKALQNRDDIDLKIAGPYTGSWIPWQGGMNLPEKYAITPDIPLPLSLGVSEYNYEMVKALLGDWVPDLVIQVDAGFHAKYKPSDGMVITVGTDPHVLNDFYDVPRKYSDKFFNMQAVYSKPGDIYLPYAYSKYDFYPDDTVEKDTDCVLIGMPYEQRVQWVNELRKRGVSVIFENGPVFDEARALYARGRIGLNWSSMDDLNCRAFEIPAMKLAPVMNYVSDMSKFLWDRVDYLGFSSLPEAIEMVMDLVEHPDYAKNLAEGAYQTVTNNNHTYDARVQQILSECGF